MCQTLHKAQSQIQKNKKNKNFAFIGILLLDRDM